MTVRLRDLALLALVAAVGGGAVIFFGLYNIGASSGHWSVTNWAIHGAMRQIVSARASGTEVPDLNDPAMVRLGAGHYETGCAPCHGTPGRPRGAIVRQMTPSPPDLAERIAYWEPPELFWIVENGIKFTGMPAWPARGREDEVWAMVAFLQELPEMSAERYHTLANGPADALGDTEVSEPVRRALRDCVRCHDDDGRGDPNGAFPRLDIQSDAALETALHAYAAGDRASGVMQAATMELDRETLSGLAAYYSRFDAVGEAPLEPENVPAEQLALGQRIARSGVPERNVGACSGCHGDEAVQTRPEFPRLSGQYAAYLEVQLELFASDVERGGGEFADLMTEAAHDLEPDEIVAVSVWFASRTP